MSRSFDLIAPPHTPFHPDGCLNLDVVELQAEHYASTGIVGAFVAGTTGESQSLTVEERLSLAERWCDVCRNSAIEVIIQVGANCLRDAAVMAAHAQRVGADAVATLAPSFLKPQTVADLIDCCIPVAAASPDLPFYLYDIPSLTNVKLPLDQFLEQARNRIPNLKGLKFTNPDLVMLQECLAVGDGEFDILFGCDEILLAGAMFGCRGAVGTTYNFAAAHCRHFVDALFAGDLRTAQRGQGELLQVIRTCQRYGFLAAAKAVMNLSGINCGPTRMPARSLSDGQIQALLRELKELPLFAGERLEVQ